MKFKKKKVENQEFDDYIKDLICSFSDIDEPDKFNLLKASKRDLKNNEFDYFIFEYENNVYKLSKSFMQVEPKIKPEKSKRKAVYMNKVKKITGMDLPEKDLAANRYINNKARELLFIKEVN